MTQHNESLEFIRSVPRRTGLHGAVRRALQLSTGVIAAGLAIGAVATAPAAPFPAVFRLGDLFPVAGGDGSAGFVLPGIDSSDGSGQSVSAAGDVNGDGIGDLIIGALSADPRGQSSAGESYVVFGRQAGNFPAIFPLQRLLPGSPGGGDGSRGFVLTGVDEYDSAGNSVSSAGDVNGDGIDDLIIGAYHAGSGAGASYVVFGSTQAFPAVLPLASLHPAGGGDGSRGFVLTGAQAYDASGNSVSAAGDVNGDGIDDLIIGAYSAGPFRVGESYVVFGSAQAFPAVLPLASLHPAGGGDGSRGFVLTGITEYDLSGESVSGAGDVNGDGIDDLIVGARFATPGTRARAGESYVVFGSTQAFPAVFPLASLYRSGGGDGSRGFVLEGAEEYDGSGVSVSGAGDVNGDGIDDLLIGAYHAGPSHAGESYVVFGSTQAFSVLQLASLHPDGGGDGSRGFVLAGVAGYGALGRSVSAAGDVNGDGLDDLIVAAPFTDQRGENIGDSYVIFGSSQGFEAVLPLATLYPVGGGDGSRGFVLSGINVDDYCGFPVSAAGDVNGDGIGDLIVGAFGADPRGQAFAGESYVVFGRATPPLGMRDGVSNQR